MQVLVIGYGKIGRVKADIWHSLGCEVYVHDVSPRAMDMATERGFKPYREETLTEVDYVLDISTPAGQHLNSLMWALDHGADDPKAILIEKPLASTEDELEAFLEFTKGVRGRSLANKIFVDESYFSSPSIRLLSETLGQNNEKIVSIEIELSKKRLPDSISGRFFDAYLGALGIEAPHMFAALEMLGIDVARLDADKMDLLVDQSMPQNQALLLHGVCGDVSVSLVSYLGDFRLVDDELVANEGIERHITVDTDRWHYLLQLDPVGGMPRLQAKLNVLDADGMRSQTTVSDDHLRAHLQQFLAEVSPSAKLAPFGIQHALVVSEALIGLRKQCRVVPIKNKDSLMKAIKTSSLGMKGVH